MTVRATIGLQVTKNQLGDAKNPLLSLFPAKCEENEENVGGKGTKI